MKAALRLASDDDKPGLESIIKDLEELINPVCDTTQRVQNDSSVTQELDEYSLFEVSSSD